MQTKNQQVPAPAMQLASGAAYRVRQANSSYRTLDELVQMTKELHGDESNIALGDAALDPSHGIASYIAIVVQIVVINLDRDDGSACLKNGGPAPQR